MLYGNKRPEFAGNVNAVSTNANEPGLVVPSPADKLYLACGENPSILFDFWRRWETQTWPSQLLKSERRVRFLELKWQCRLQKMTSFNLHSELHCKLRLYSKSLCKLRFPKKQECRKIFLPEAMQSIQAHNQSYTEISVQKFTQMQLMSQLTPLSSLCWAHGRHTN